MRTLLILLISLMGMSLFSFSHEAPEGILLSGLTYDALDGKLPFQEITMPLALMGMHRAADYYDGEAAFGDTQQETWAINGIFTGIGYLLCNDEKVRNKYIYCTFWGMIVPDVLLKDITHGPENHAIDLTRGQQLIFSGVSLLAVKFTF